MFLCVLVFGMLKMFFSGVLKVGCVNDGECEELL